MYILCAQIENIRSIRRFEIGFSPEECPGWHVLIGDNGAGKTTMVRALALSLVGDEAEALWRSGEDWLRTGSKRGSISTRFLCHHSVDKPAEDAAPADAEKRDRTAGASIVFVEHRDERNRKVTIEMPGTWFSDGWDPWCSAAHRGWFSASFGPFRRFQGGNLEREKLFRSHPRLASHLSAFGEDVAFPHVLSWLRDLRFKQLESREDEDEGLLGDVRRFINDSRLLPHDTTLQEVTSDDVVFRDGNDCKVDINQLSDGYRSVLSLTFELIRQLIHAYGRERVFLREGESVKAEIDVPGVVIVDEIDAHLHPTWQRRIGKWFTERFPKLQFIVTTHSPLVCQAAELGSVWRLPTPGIDDDCGRITGTELNRLVYGNVLDAYGTEAFGGDVNRSESSKEKMRRLAQLNQKSLRGSLTEGEQAELMELRSILPTSAGTMGMVEGSTT